MRARLTIVPFDIFIAARKAVSILFILKKFKLFPLIMGTLEFLLSELLDNWLDFVVDVSNWLISFSLLVTNLSKTSFFE